MAEVKAASLAAEQTCLNWRSCFRLEERGIYIIYRIYIIMYIYRGNLVKVLGRLQALGRVIGSGQLDLLQRLLPLQCCST